MKKGISLIVLVITIIVMVILAGVAIINASNTLADTSKSKLQLDISQLEYLMNTYKIRKNGNIDFEIVEFDTTKLSSQELVQFSGETIQNNKINLYIIDLLSIDAESVNYGNMEAGEKDRYLYSITTGKVYYELGLNTKDGTYYYVQDGE